LSSDSEDLKDMVNLLRQGAKLTDIPCPACSSPLFRMLDGELWCAKCKKRVIVVSEGRTAEAVTPIVLDKVEGTLLTKIDELNELIMREVDPEKVGELGSVLITLLESLEKIRKLRRKG